MKRRWIGLALTAGVIAVYALRLDDVAGLYKDDAYYLVLAKALASGDGYALINSATTPLLPGFPPGFALLLAPIFALFPSYPDNLLWLKAVSIAAMIGTGLLTFVYWHACRDIGRGRAAVIALLTALVPGFVFLATSTVMSECVFTFALMGSAVALEHAARAEEPADSRRAVVLAALATTAAWLIRAAGIALVGGGVVFLLWRRGWRAAAVFVLTCAIGYVPWAAYSAAHSPTRAERDAYGGDIVRGYGSPTATGMPERGIANIVNVFGRDIGAVIFPAGYRGPEESGLEVFLLKGARDLRAGSMGIGAPAVATSSVLSVIVLIGALVTARRRIGVAEVFCVLTVAMVVIGTSEVVFRYVLPLAPFVIAYFLTGVESVATRLRAGSGLPAFRIAAGCMLFLFLAEHGGYVWLTRQGPPPLWVEDDRDVRLVTDYVNAHLPARATVVSTNPGLVYLLTGRKGLTYIDPVNNWERWRGAGISHVLVLDATGKPSRFREHGTLFESPRLNLWVAELGPDQGR